MEYPRKFEPCPQQLINFLLVAIPVGFRELRELDVCCSEVVGGNLAGSFDV